MPDLEDALEAYENNGYKTAFKIFMRLAVFGHFEAQCSLGNMYSNGECVAQDEERKTGENDNDDESSAQPKNLFGEEDYATDNENLG